jgi:uncharacterized protein (TIGR02145 family)
MCPKVKALSTIQKLMEAGTQSISLPSISAGVYFHKIKSEDDEFVIKNNSQTGVSRGMAVSVQGTSPDAFSRQAESYVPINDVIAVAKDGYLNYRVIVTNSDTSGIEITMIVCAGTVTDIDGTIYQAVKIGNQVWTVENLRTTKYNNGIPITLDTSIATWTNATTVKYCYYNNTAHADSIKKYGALYNWYIVDTKKLAPAGWHVPDTTEWNTLANYLIANGYNWDGSTDSNKIAKSMTAKADWRIYTVPGTIGCDLTKNNKSGFSALPGGYRYKTGFFDLIGYNSYWWSTTVFASNGAFCRFLGCDYANLSKKSYSGKSCGHSVRLVKDSERRE